MLAAYTNSSPKEEVFAPLKELFTDFLEELASQQLLELPEDEVEQLLMQRGPELMRQALESHLRLRSQRESDVVVENADGTRLNHHRRQQRRVIGSMFGPVSFTRTVYCQRRVGGLAPLDADLNLPQGKHSLNVRRWAALFAAHASFEQTQDWLRGLSGATAGKRQLQELVEAAATHVTAFYESRLAEPRPTTTQEIGVLTFDMKGVVMRHEDLRPAMKKQAQTTRPKLDMRRTKGEKKSRKRMASVASVYTVDRFVRTPTQILEGLRGTSHEEGPRRPRPENKRVWASLGRSVGEVIDEAFLQAIHLDPTRSKAWVVPVDGDRRHLKQIESSAAAHGLQITIVLDLIHVIEYLWKAAHAFFAEGSPQAEDWVADRLMQVLRNRARTVSAGIRRRISRENLKGTAKKRAESAARYLRNYSRYMRYWDYLERGYPITSGVIEGACRSLVRDRMELTGARWSLDGAESILLLRSVIASDDFDDYWAFHKRQEYERNHGACYQGGHHPEPVTRQPHLRLIE